MNFNLNNIPDRNQKPRTFGLTMVMDKGLSINEAKNFLTHLILISNENNRQIKLQEEMMNELNAASGKLQEALNLFFRPNKKREDKSST